MDILDKFPEMVPSYLASQKDDRELLARLFRFSDLTAAPLKRVFPEVHFYQGRDGKKPPHPYLMAVTATNRYMMTDEFNRLLLDGGRGVTDENMLPFARAFVILAIGGGSRSIPAIAFLDATKTEQVISGRSYNARLRVRVGDRIEEWFFALSVWKGQFGSVYRRGTQGLIHLYTPVTVESLPSRGQLNPTPNVEERH